MRIVIDLQSAQGASRHRGIGRYSIALAQAMARNSCQHEILIALNGLFPDTIEHIRASFDGLVSQDNIHVWQAKGPVSPLAHVNTWRRHTAELIRETFLASLQPDIVHVTSLFEGFGDDAIHSIGQTPATMRTAVTLYDLIPLVQSDTYLRPNPTYEKFYREKLTHLKRADLYLAISEFSRQEALTHLEINAENSANIGAAADPIFRPIRVTDNERNSLFKKFGIDRSFLMYSGATDERKNHLRLIRAYSLLPKTLRARFQLVIAGHLPNEHRDKFETYAKLSGLTRDDIRITGRVTDLEMLQLYNLCSLFVFPSWHEGFGLPALEAMSCGAPVIASNTSSLPEVVGRSDALFNPFDDLEISQKIGHVLSDDRLRDDLRRHGLDQARKFSWDTSATCAIEAFERICSMPYARGTSIDATQPSHLPSSWLIDAVAKIRNPPSDDGDWIDTAVAIAQNHPPQGKRQLLVDISELVNRDSKTGIQRVVRSVLSELMSNPPEGFTVEPVYANQNDAGYRYARTFAQSFTPVKGDRSVPEDSPIEIQSRDVFLGLDLQHHVVLHQGPFYAHLKRVGVQVYFVIYDLLPVLLPQMFPEGTPSIHAQWLGVLARADGVVCISRAVADEMIVWLSVAGPQRLRPLKLGWFHLGGDVAGSLPTRGLPNDVSNVISALSSRPTFLMVGTIEPRKGQLQTLMAFDRLWREGVNVNLVLVGKHGWNVDLLIEMLRVHSELGKRLFWLSGISDEYLEKVYLASTCLIAASEGEGFGLPLIEAAQQRKPIIARDIPVFREVAGEHAFYFSGHEPDALARGVQDWLALNKLNKAPQSDGMPWRTWKESTRDLLGVILDGKWYQEWMSDGIHRFWGGGDDRIGTQVGKRSGNAIHSTKKAGYLIYGPYIPLDAGSYRVEIKGLLGTTGPTGARIDVAVDQGRRILGESLFKDAPTDGSLITLCVSLDSPCTDFEVRVWVDDSADLSITMIVIEPLLADHELVELASTVDASEGCSSSQLTKHAQGTPVITIV